MSRQTVLQGAGLVPFACLPSLTLHPSWEDVLLTPAHWAVMRALAGDATALAAWHRHCSAALLAQQSLPSPEIEALEQPAAKWVLASALALARLARDLGAQICAADIRRHIAGPSIRALHRHLGAATLTRVSQPAFGRLPGPAPLAAPQASVETLVARIDQFGFSALGRLWDSLPRGLSMRGRMKCPMQASGLSAWSAHAVALWIAEMPCEREGFE